MSLGPLMHNICNVKSLYTQTSISSESQSEFLQHGCITETTLHDSKHVGNNTKQSNLYTRGDDRQQKLSDSLIWVLSSDDDVSDELLKIKLLLLTTLSSMYVWMNERFIGKRRTSKRTRRSQSRTLTHAQRNKNQNKYVDYWLSIGI